MDQGRASAIAAEFITKDLKVSAKLLLEARASLLNEVRRGGEDARES